MKSEPLELTKAHSLAFDAIMRIFKGEETPLGLRPKRIDGETKKRFNRKLSTYYGMFCYWCDRKLNAKENDPHCRSLDHVIPRRHGGPNAFFNIVLSCRSCDIARGKVTDKHEIYAYYGVTEEELRKYL